MKFSVFISHSSKDAALATSAAADCKGKEGKLAKQYAEQAAAWSIDQP